MNNFLVCSLGLYLGTKVSTPASRIATGWSYGFTAEDTCLTIPFLPLSSVSFHASMGMSTKYNYKQACISAEKIRLTYVDIEEEKLLLRDTCLFLRQREAKWVMTVGHTRTRKEPTPLAGKQSAFLLLLWFWCGTHMEELLSCAQADDAQVSTQLEFTLVNLGPLRFCAQPGKPCLPSSKISVVDDVSFAFLL
jgi:hypothetical protein